MKTQSETYESFRETSLKHVPHESSTGCFVDQTGGTGYRGTMRENCPNPKNRESGENVLSEKSQTESAVDAGLFLARPPPEEPFSIVLNVRVVTTCVSVSWPTWIPRGLSSSSRRGSFLTGGCKWSVVRVAYLTSPRWNAGDGGDDCIDAGVLSVFQTQMARAIRGASWRSVELARDFLVTITSSGRCGG